MAVVVVLVLLGGGLAAAAAAAPGAPGEVPGEATAQGYLLRALGLLRAYSINRDRIDWPRAEADAVRSVAGAAAPSGAYSAIRTVIADLGNRHTMLLDPARARPPAAGTIEVPAGWAKDGIGMPTVPGLVADSEGERRYVDAGVAALRSAEAGASCGWVVDLRGNTGGNMWPMLTVLAPLLGDGDVGSFAGPGVGRSVWSIGDGQALLDGEALTAEANPVRLSRSGPPVAVLASRNTASSGEATLIAFRGRARTAVFGEPTAGYATGNRVFDLSDGAKLLVTTVVDVDRTSRVYGAAPIEPDFPAGDPEAAARKWLRSHCG